MRGLRLIDANTRLIVVHFGHCQSHKEGSKGKPQLVLRAFEEGANHCLWEEMVDISSHLLNSPEEVKTRLAELSARFFVWWQKNNQESQYWDGTIVRFDRLATQGQRNVNSSSSQKKRA